MIVYALSAACGCAPAGYSYYRDYYAPQTSVIEFRSESEWGGDSALPIGYSYEYTSPYYVGSPYRNYPYPYLLDARHHQRTAVAAPKHHPTKIAKAAIPLPKADPRKRAERIAAKLPPHTKAVIE
jgi:hypothetical protein